MHELDVSSLPQLRGVSRCAEKDERSAKASERAQTHPERPTPLRESPARSSAVRKCWCGISFAHPLGFRCRDGSGAAELDCQAERRQLVDHILIDGERALHRWPLI